MQLSVRQRVGTWIDRMMHYIHGRWHISCSFIFIMLWIWTWARSITMSMHDVYIRTFSHTKWLFYFLSWTEQARTRIVEIEGTRSICVCNSSLNTWGVGYRKLAQLLLHAYAEGRQADARVDVSTCMRVHLLFPSVWTPCVHYHACNWCMYTLTTYSPNGAFQFSADQTISARNKGVFSPWNQTPLSTV